MSLTPAELNIADIFAAVASAHPERDCLVQGDRRFTWSETADRVNRLAAVLTAAGVGRHRPFAGSSPWESTQGHVALYLHNGNEYLEGMLGAYSAVAAPVNINYRYRAAELAYVLGDAAPGAVIVHSSFAPLLAEVREVLATEVLILQVDDGSGTDLIDGARWYEEALASVPDHEVLTTRCELAGRRSGDDLYICYTGGTTGMPKGVLWRQADFVVSALGVRRADGTEYESLDELVQRAAAGRVRALPAPPFMHGAAHWNALSCWIAGGTVIIQDRPDHFDPADIWSTVQRHRATSLLIVGDSFARPLLDELERADYDLGSLRHLLSGGAVLSSHVKERLAAALGGVTIVDVLGSTESGRQAVATRGPEAAATTPDATSGASVGFVPSDTAQLVSEDRRRVLNADDAEIGWLTQTGRMPRGYLGDQQRTEDTFPLIDGVRHAVAGDRARYGTDGTLELLGRESVCINTGGEKVFAEEVEVALTSHPAVLDAIVCGRPSPRWGSEVVAVVALAVAASPVPASPVPASPAPAGAIGDSGDLTQQLIEHCRARLAGFKAPKAVVFVDSVVRSPSGKADYSWARRMAEAAAVHSQA